MKIIRLLAVFVCVIGVWGSMSTVMAQTTKVETEYLMTYVMLLDPFTPVDNSLVIVHVKPGGWFKGPKISGKFIPPCGDWIRVMPSGVMRIDVRSSLLTNDGAIIYMSYNGVLQQSKESAERLNKGEVLTTKDIPYFVEAPTFETMAEKYAWLNSIQAINKLVECKVGEGGYVKFDTFIVK
jgi:hypothetical protein